MKRLAAATREIYERNGARFDAERAKVLFERAWLDRFLGCLPAKRRILDVGCGSGDPIAKYLLAQGCVVTGVDFSKTLIAIARERFPGSRWLVADMRALELKETFDGIIGWHSFFHLTPEEQRSTLEILSAHLAPAGALMVTVGPEAGEVTGHVGGDEVYHASLSPEEYRSVLNRLGMKIVHFKADDPECGGATVLVAKKDIGSR